VTRIYSFALGNIWRWAQSENRNGLLRYLKNLDLSGVEFTFPTENALYAFRLSKENLSWLKTLPYVTIHAPFNLFFEENQDNILHQMDIISSLYDTIRAENVIIHPTRSNAIELLKHFSFKVSIENMPPKMHFDGIGLKKIFAAHPDFQFCLDVSHAYLWSKHETEKLINIFGERISQIHLSGTYRRKSHQSLLTVTDDFMHSIQCIKTLNVPLVIEEDFENKSIAIVKKELSFIRRLFG